VRGRSVARLLAVAVFAVAFVGLDGPARESFAVHMTQHMTLVVVLAPLLVLSWSPRRLPRWTGTVVFALVVVVLQTAMLVLWHVPVVFDAAAAHTPLHVLEHLTLLGSALLGWWVILAAPFGTPVRFAACAAAAAPMLFLGVLLTFASHPWYTSYESTGHLLAPLVDQQTGGAIMWGPAGLAYVVAAAWLVGSALAHDERLLTTTRG
jgi:putative membrane protein